MALDLKSYFGNIPKKQRYLLIGLVAAGVLTGYYFLMNPLWEEKGRHEATLQKLQADLEQKQLIAANRPKLEAEIKALEKELAEALVRLPAELPVPASWRGLRRQVRQTLPRRVHRARLS